MRIIFGPDRSTCAVLQERFSKNAFGILLITARNFFYVFIKSMQSFMIFLKIWDFYIKNPLEVFELTFNCTITDVYLLLMVFFYFLKGMNVRTYSK